MKKHWTWSLGLVICLVPILAAQEIYKEIVVVGQQATESEDNNADNEVDNDGTRKVRKTTRYRETVPNPADVARKREQELARAVDGFNQAIDKKEYDKARKIAREVIQTMPEHPVAKLMWSRVKAIEEVPKPSRPRVRGTVTWQDVVVKRKKAAPAFQAVPVPALPRNPVPKQVTVTYPVADLVVPIPKKVTLSLGKQLLAGKTQNQQADFEPLMSLIQKNVAPGSWGRSTKTGGDMKAYETTLSLIVRHTPAVQAEIADLLTQLRRVQEVQVCLELRVITVLDSDDYWATYNKANKTQITADTQSQVLSAKQTERLIGHLQSHVATNILQAPKVTFFDGQVLDLKIGQTDIPDALLHSKVSADRRTVRINSALGCRTQEDVLAKAVSSRVADGGSVLLNTGATRWIEARVEQGVPMLSKVPYVNRLFKNVGVARERTRILLLVTPRIIVQEEEEELLIAPPAKKVPRVRYRTHQPLPPSPYAPVRVKQATQTPVLAPSIRPATLTVTPRIVIQEEEEEVILLPTPGRQLNSILPQTGGDKSEKKTGTMLPFGYYLKDDVQFFPPSREDKLEQKTPATSSHQEHKDDVQFFLGISR